MPAPPGGSKSGELSYLRARPNGEVDSRRVFRVVIVICLFLLAAVVAVTTVGAAHQNSVQARLHRQGVLVQVTVTGCIADSSGIGLHITSYECRGSYALDGRSYNAMIGGGTSRPVGQTFQGVTVRSDPALLSTTAAAAKRFSPWTPYITPIVLAAVTVALAFGLVVSSRPSRRARPMRSAVAAR